jgi:hypothetical protein
MGSTFLDPIKILLGKNIATFPPTRPDDLRKQVSTLLERDPSQVSFVIVNGIGGPIDLNSRYLQLGNIESDEQLMNYYSKLNQRFGRFSSVMPTSASSLGGGKSKKYKKTRKSKKSKKSKKTRKSRSRSKVRH